MILGPSLIVKRGEVLRPPQPPWKRQSSKERVLKLSDIEAKSLESEVRVLRGLYRKLIRGWMLCSSRETPDQLHRDLENWLAELLFVYPDKEIAGRLAYIVSDEGRYERVMDKLQRVSDVLNIRTAGGTTRRFTVGVAGTTKPDVQSRSRAVTRDLTIVRSGVVIESSDCYAATMASARNKWIVLASGALPVPAAVD